MSTLPALAPSAQARPPEVTLLLLLGHSAYKVLPLPAAPEAGSLHRFQLVKLEDRPEPARYTVTLHADATCSCDCSNHDGISCPHLQAAFTCGLLWVPPLERRDVDLAYRDDDADNFRPLLRMVEG